MESLPRFRLSEDGDRLLTAAGTTFHASGDSETDMTYAGRLSSDVIVHWADHSTETNEWTALVIAVNDYDASSRKLAFYSDDFFNEVSVVDLADIPERDGVAPTTGSYIPQSKDGATIVMLVQADGPVHRHAVQIYKR